MYFSQILFIACLVIFLGYQLHILLRDLVRNQAHNKHIAVFGYGVSVGLPMMFILEIMSAQLLQFLLNFRLVFWQSILLTVPVIIFFAAVSTLYHKARKYPPLTHKEIFNYDV